MCKDMYRKSETAKVEPSEPIREFYEYIPYFVEYPIEFLEMLAETFRLKKETTYDIKRLIGLLKIDNLALDIAYQEGIHPISGIEWDFEDEKRYNLLIDRNFKMIRHLENIIQISESKTKS